MKKLNYDIVIIGGGPAGLSAAVEAAKDKYLRTLLIERDKNLGGILQQCIHDGFGLFRFGQRLSGTEYAQRYIDFVKEESIDIKLDTMVLEVTKAVSYTHLTGITSRKSGISNTCCSDYEWQVCQCCSALSPGTGAFPLWS